MIFLSSKAYSVARYVIGDVRTWPVMGAMRELVSCSLR
jgi:hypothetical protein